MKVLVTSTAGAGHVFPMVPLVWALRDAGHEVTWAIPPAGVPNIRALGLRAVPAGLDRAELSALVAKRRPDFGAEFIAASPVERRILSFTAFFAEFQAPAMFESLRPLIHDLQPDLVVHEPNEAGAAPLATARGIPRVVVGFGGFHPEVILHAAEPFLAPLWSSERLELPPRLGLYEDRYLHPFPPSFGSSAFADTIRPMRPSGFDGARPGEPVPDWLGGLGVERPLVYVTFGTEIATLAPIATVVTALDGANADVVVTVGRDLDPDAFRPWPANVRIERWVPQRLVLERATLLVSHAGSGAMLGAASAGIPQLCLPIGADQFENAKVVTEAGCGLAIEARTATAESIRDAMDRLLHEQNFQQRARQIADEIASMPTPEAVISNDDHLQAHIGS